MKNVQEERKMLEDCAETRISLSLLEFENDLLRQLDQIARSICFSKILDFVNSGKLYSLHIDVMRPPLIPNRSAFPVQLIGHLYENLHEKIILEIHLMVKEPDILIQEIDKFIELKEKMKISLIIQREAYGSEEEITKSLRVIKSLGYKAGIGLNLPTPFESLTDEMIRNADLVLIMSVPMGMGGQEYDEQATERIRSISKRFPTKPIKVDGGINDKNAPSVVKAGATILVIGSFVTRSRKPLDALGKFAKILKNSKNFKKCSEITVSVPPGDNWDDAIKVNPMDQEADLKTVSFPCLWRIGRTRFTSLRARDLEQQ